MSSLESTEADSHREAISWVDRVDRFVANYATEPMLWPVLLAVLGHFVIALAPIMLLAVRDRSPGSIVGLVVAALLCGALFFRRGRRRLSALNLMVLGTWAASVAAAWLGHVYQWL